MDAFAAGKALGEAGQHAEAVEVFATVAGDLTRSAAERAHALAHQAAALRADGRPAASLATARAAIDLARSAGALRAEAHGQLALATTLIAQFVDGEDVEVGDAMDALDRAAAIHAEHSPIDLGATLLTMAELLKLCGELDGATAIYARVTQDLSAPQFATPPEVAAHANELIGRASVGLAEISQVQGRVEQARSEFAAATRLLAAAGGPTAAALLDDIADYLASEPHLDPDAAAQVRALALSCRRG
jgi:tetratricopeptide (TPR) repeat protein